MCWEKIMFYELLLFFKISLLYLMHLLVVVKAAEKQNLGCKKISKMHMHPAPRDLIQNSNLST